MHASAVEEWTRVLKTSLWVRWAARQAKQQTILARLQLILQGVRLDQLDANRAVGSIVQEGTD